MQRLVLSAIVLTLLCLGTTANAAVDACQRMEQQRDKLYVQLRRPHNAQRGNQLRARLRDLDFRIAHECR